MQTIIRLMVIPIFILFFYAGAISQKEKIFNLEWIGWMSLYKTEHYKSKIELTNKENYRLALFVDYKDILQRDDVKAKAILIYKGNAVRELIFSESSIGLTKGLLNSALKDKALVIGYDEKDPFYHTKNIQYTSIFTVSDGGDYEIMFDLISSPELRNLGLLLKKGASDFPYYFSIIIFLYIPFFISSEIYFLLRPIIKRFKSKYLDSKQHN